MGRTSTDGGKTRTRSKTTKRGQKKVPVVLLEGEYIMKEFERWWNKEIRPYIYNPKDKDIVKAGWKAALEWIYYAGVLTDLPAALIKKELNDDTL